MSCVRAPSSPANKLPPLNLPASSVSAPFTRFAGHHDWLLVVTGEIKWDSVILARGIVVDINLCFLVCLLHIYAFYVSSVSVNSRHPANKRPCPNVVLISGQRCRRWHNIKSALGYCLVVDGYIIAHYPGPWSNTNELQIKKMPVDPSLTKAMHWYTRHIRGCVHEGTDPDFRHVIGRDGHLNPL